MKGFVVLSALVIVGIQAQGDPKAANGAKGPGFSGINGDIMKALEKQYKNGVPLGPAPSGCAALEVMIARGTFEPGSFGTMVGDPVLAAVKKEMTGEDVRGYAVQYPASAEKDSRTKGVEDVVNRITTKAKECPKMKFALVGYSQGGSVVSGAAPKIPQDLRAKVVAMVLYGAGKGESSVGDIKQKTMANCAPNDNCGIKDDSKKDEKLPAGTLPGHLSYSNPGSKWHSRTAKYIAAGFHGQPQGYKLELSPTENSTA